MTYSSGILRSYFETGWRESEHFFLEIVGGIERVVSDIDITLERECEFPMCEQLRRYYIPYQLHSKPCSEVMTSLP